MANSIEFPNLEDCSGEEWQKFLDKIGPQDLGLDNAWFEDPPQETQSPILPATDFSSGVRVSPVRNLDTVEGIDPSLTSTTKSFWDTDPSSGSERPLNPDIKALQHKIEAMQQR